MDSYKKNKTFNILVTGAGALLGQGILRLLQVSNIQKKIYTADPDLRSTGHWLGDHALKILPVSHKNYFTTITKIIEEHKIDLIFVGTDVELPLFAEKKNYLFEKYGCQVVVSPKKVIDIANDKYKTAKFLEENNFPFPFSVMANNMEELKQIEEQIGFPLFAKPVDGARSMGIKKINNAKELYEIYNENSNLVVQEFLPEDDGEYTTGCIVYNGQCKSIVSLRRDLRDGNTYRTYREDKTTQYDEQIRAIAEKLNSEGPVNFQYRIINGKPIIFEINGRFSGTTPLRYFYGFNEVEAIAKYLLLGEDIKMNELKNGMVFRAWSDVFINEDEYKSFDDKGELEQPNAKFYGFNLK